MARFPKSEEEILALAQMMVSGLTANPGIFPAPPVSPANLQTTINDYIAKRDVAVQKQAEAEQATTDKNEALDELISVMKTDIRYAENIVEYDDDKLKLIGWGGRSARTPMPPPGQPRTLEAPRQGEGWVFLDWKEPLTGGKPAAYKIQRRQRPEGPWLDIATALESEITLTNQERGVEWEYRVIAVNKAGESEPSNTVLAVL